MPTNNERREVARRLRDNAGQKPGWVIPWAAFNDAYEHEGAELLNRLADLIEPEERTCRVVTEMRALSQTQDMHTKSCSSCGYVFGSEQHRQLLPGLGERVAIKPVRIPKFCTNCGAKVVKR